MDCDNFEFTQNSNDNSDKKDRKCIGKTTRMRRNPTAPKRKKSSEKERERNEEIKTKLQYLAGRIPFVQKDLSRIRTLRLTKEYITHLIRILHGETITCPHTGIQRPLSKDDFRQIVNRELQTNNSYKDRAETEIATVYSTASPSSCSSRPSYTANCEQFSPIGVENYRDDNRTTSIRQQSIIGSTISPTIQPSNTREYLHGSRCILRKNDVEEESPIPSATHVNIYNDKKYITNRIADRLPLLQTFPATSMPENIFETPQYNLLLNEQNSFDYRSIGHFLH